MVTGGGDSGPTRRSYDAVAADYAAAIASELVGKPLDRALLDALLELVGGDPVADVGCGPGHVTGYLAGRGGPVIGLDLSPEMCALGARGTSLPFGAADMTTLPIRSGSLGGIVSLYAVIHLDTAARAAAYREFARTLRPGGHVLIAFHVSDADTPAGGSRPMTEWWEHPVDLTFHFLDPNREIAAAALAGLELVARLDREPHPGVEHPSRRAYLLMRRLF